MAVEEVDYANLFAANDYHDDGMSNIDFQSVLNFPNEDDNYDALKKVNAPDPDPDPNPEDCASTNDSRILDTSQIHKGPELFEEPHFSGFGLVDSSTGWSPFCFDVSDSWGGGSDSLFDSAIKSLRDRKHDNAFSFGENVEICSEERTGVSSREIPANGVESTPEAHSYGDNLNLGAWRGENAIQFKRVRVGEAAESEYASLSSIIENGDVNFEGYVGNTIGGSSGNQENGLYTDFGNPIMEADRYFPVAASTNSTAGQDSHVPDNFIDFQLSSNCYQGTYGRPVVSDSATRILPYGMPSQPWTNEEMMGNMKADNEKFYADMASPRMSSGMPSSNTGDISCQDGQIMLADSGYPSFSSGNVIFNGEMSVPFSTYMSSGDQPFYVKGEREQQITPYQNNFHNGAAELNVGQEVKQLTSVNISQSSKHVNSQPNMVEGSVGNLNLKSVDRSLPHARAPIASENQFACLKRGGGEMIQHKHVDSEKVGNSLNISQSSKHVNSQPNMVEGSVGNLNLKSVDRSLPHARAPIASENQFACVKRGGREMIQHKHVDSEKVGNSLNISQSSKHVNSQPNMVGNTRLKARDKRNILQAALQVLSQPKSEDIPPDGLLAVPLFKHQRIALAWMVQRETSSSYCSGGILADDQGLGKTVTTIALILKEKPPALTVCPNVQKGELETSNPSMNLLEQAKGRPSAGTLIICPTCVLRQWGEELQNKVTSQANLSVLVYYGRYRTKDPYEVAKYDVVLTTYSILSVEFLKQPIVNKDGEEKGIFEDYAVPSRKRKDPSNSNMSGKKELDSTMLEDVSQPLAKMAWFRVVLDEAQSIKNHKTQVARACWGLHAKRRWCLSGTPIQNSIDDLYSYFKFLRYSPYTDYRSFLAEIKVPISSSPTEGYRNLQDVLNKIMLRRTKATLLDGEPIISLLPKFVELKKVDFSREERGFYSRLEADYCAQFQEYANAGTVQQNYVNILLMLLHLRQACDHPLLVKRNNSSSQQKSSVEMAKNLPQEKQTSLSKCLEASLALCGICNGPPKDAVVSVCDHIFCNQCICERLTGNDKQCPAINCKGQLNTASVFSKATLSNFSNQDCDNSPGCSGSKVEEFEPWSRSHSYDSSKMKAALEVLKSLCTAVGEKAIVFTQWTSMLDLLELSLKNSSIQYRRLDGTMSVAGRDKAMKDFNALPEVSVMIMSLKAASLGLNLVAASHVLMLDLWWNPTTEDQAIDRAHRIGQTRRVTVLRLTVRDTVEDRILALQQKKRKVVADAFGENETDGLQSHLTVDDLKCLFMI